MRPKIDFAQCEALPSAAENVQEFVGLGGPHPCTGRFDMNYQRFFEDAIDQLHAERRYRVFA
ncbi:MAG: hypothetical protein E5X49_07925, partial [Mesorhizobium sp.]